MKTCRKCLVKQDYSNFHKNKQTKDGHAVYCRPCKSLLDKEWISEKPEEIAKRKVRSKEWQKNNSQRYKESVKRWKESNREQKWSLDKKSHLWTHYRLTLEDFTEMHSLQKGKCLICKRGKKLIVDHDHACCPGKISCGNCVRGLICFRCNSLLGLAQDSKEILSAAIKYIQKN
jgi:hypothetical protein